MTGRIVRFVPNTISVAGSKGLTGTGPFVVYALVEDPNNPGATWQITFSLPAGPYPSNLLGTLVQFAPKNDGTGTFISF